MNGTSNANGPAAICLALLLASGAVFGIWRTYASGVPSLPWQDGFAEWDRNAFVAFNGLLQRLAGRRLVSNSKNIDCVRLDNGQLALGSVLRPEGLRQKAARDIALSLRGVREALAPAGTPLVFVLCPSKVPPGGRGLPEGLEDEDNILGDLLVTALADEGIECLDLRERIVREGLDHASLFFKTDHHWLPSTGLWAANEIGTFLAERHALPFKPALTDPARYRPKRLGERFLGSFGRRVGLGYAGTEPFDAVLPHFRTDFVFEIPGGAVRREGPFRKAFLRMPQGKSPPWDSRLYASYIGAQQPVSRIENRRGGNGKTLCVVKDSFAAVLLPHLAIQYGKIVFLDPRVDARISLFASIRAENPDAVLFILNPNSLIRRNGFFGKRFLSPGDPAAGDGSPSPAGGDEGAPPPAGEANFSIDTSVPDVSLPLKGSP